MCLNEEELEVVRDAVTLLEPFEEVTREMSIEKFTHLSKAIPITKVLQECMKYRVDSRKNSMQASSIGGELQKWLQKRFPAVEKIFTAGATTLLDTRFKKVPFVDTGNVKAIADRLLNIMQRDYSKRLHLSHCHPSRQTSKGKE